MGVEEWGSYFNLKVFKSSFKINMKFKCFIIRECAPWRNQLYCSLYNPTHKRLLWVVVRPEWGGQKSISSCSCCEVNI